MEAIPTDQEIKEQSKKIITILKELEMSPKWEKNGDKPCLMYKLSVEGRIASKGVAIVNFPFEEVCKFLMDDNSLGLIDPMLVTWKILRVVQAQIRVSYSQYKATWPVSNRDFVSVQNVYMESENKCYQGVTSINYPYPEQPDVVRAVVNIGGYIMQRIEGNKTRVTYFSDADIKGSIPSKIANLISGWQGQVPSKIEPAMKGLKK